MHDLKVRRTCAFPFHMNGISWTFTALIMVFGSQGKSAAVPCFVYLKNNNQNFLSMAATMKPFIKDIFFGIV